MDSGIIADIRLRAQKKTIYELRQIARAVGVSRPADGKKERLIDEMISIATCKTDPAPRSLRGAPPKSSEYDKKLVADIEECRAHYSSIKGVRSDEGGVSDGSARKQCSGVLSRSGKGYVLQAGCLCSASDIAVHESFVNRYGLKEGDRVCGMQTCGAEGRGALVSLKTINGFLPGDLKRTPLTDLTAVYPETRLKIFARAEDAEARMVDFFAPVGRGQRGLISGGCTAAEINLLKQIALAICLNERDLQVVICLIAESPEAVNSFRTADLGAEIFYTYFSEGNGNVVSGAEFVINYCKRQAECGKNVVLLADGLARLERAAAAVGAPGAAKRFLSSAVCTDEVSLTVLAALSAEDGELERDLSEVANMRAYMSLSFALQGINPPLDVLKTFTTGAEALQTRNELFAAATLRKRIIRGKAEPEEIAALFTGTANNGQIIRELTDG